MNMEYLIMEFVDLKKFTGRVEKDRYTLPGIARIVGMTYAGLRLSIKRKTLPVRKLEIIYKKTGIRPVEFFEFKVTGGGND